MNVIKISILPEGNYMKADFYKRILRVNLSCLSLLTILVFIACNSNESTQKDTEKNPAPQKKVSSEPPDYNKLVGRWLRPDGGYIIEIQKVDMNGQIQAAYYNPRSINVSQALAAQKDGIIEVFIELRDTGYPGATYTLKYDQSNDILAGLYYQPAAGQTFDVQFVRKE
jgi:hypothetical protein